MAIAWSNLVKIMGLPILEVPNDYTRASMSLSSKKNGSLVREETSSWTNYDGHIGMSGILIFFAIRPYCDKEQIQPELKLLSYCLFSEQNNCIKMFIL